MLSWFRRTPQFMDEAFVDLANMLSAEDENPVPQRESLDAERLDYSLASLRHVDEYLVRMHEAKPDGEDAMRVVLRVGAYVGEVVRRLRPGHFRWVTHQEAARHSKLLKGWEMSLATAGILWSNAETMAFPLAKVCKFIENGSEDSVYAFALVIGDENREPGQSF